MIALIIQLVQEAVTLAPGIVTDLQDIFSKANPTPADWEALRAKILSKSYEDFVPASALPALAASKPVVLPDPAPVATEAATAAPETNEQAAAALLAAVAEPEAQAQVQQTKPAAAPSPYLADGSPNPAFNHAG
jgi:hypothetical protein